jgi:hypothetical protein
MRTKGTLRADLTCETCSWFRDDPRDLERAFAGITALSSAYGSTRGRAGVCGVDDSFRDPGAACAEYRARDVEGA